MVMKKERLVVLTGAGMSAESGIPTFRAIDGLWENHRIEDVATPEAWEKNPHLVLEFYNQRRINVRKASPNRGHLILAELEKQFEVVIITQNIDDLHERAGSTNVVHLHGEIMKSRSSIDPKLVYPIEGDLLQWGEKCDRGEQRRPHIVWFGEAVPMMDASVPIVNSADKFLVVGTSLQVYPAASLIHYTRPGIAKFIVDPHIPQLSGNGDWVKIEKGGSEGLEIFRSLVLN